MARNRWLTGSTKTDYRAQIRKNEELPRSKAGRGHGTGQETPAVPVVGSVDLSKAWTQSLAPCGAVLDEDTIYRIAELG
jgi:hypothetical protein